MDKEETVCNHLKNKINKKKKKTGANPVDPGESFIPRIKCSCSWKAIFLKTLKMVISLSKYTYTTLTCILVLHNDGEFTFVKKQKTKTFLKLRCSGEKKSVCNEMVLVKAP